MLLVIIYLAAIFCLSVGFLTATNPKLIIEFQIKFYKMINWRIEPISMSKEIRNTRIMGIFLVIVAIGTIAYTLKSKF